MLMKTVEMRSKNRSSGLNVNINTLFNTNEGN